MAESKKKEEDVVKELLLPEDPKIPSTPKPPKPNPTTKAFSFWAYLTLLVSLLTFLFSSLPFLHPKDDKSWFLSLPDDLRHHYSMGKLIKVHTNPNRRSTEVFVVDHGPRHSETVVLIHGLGCSSYSFRRVLHSLGSSGFRAVAIDLPGSGFSGSLDSEEEKRWGGVMGRFWDVYSNIREKGLFWGFDQLIETGQIPYEESAVRVSGKKEIEILQCGSAQMGQIIGQVIDSMALAPVHLVLHDSALGAGTNWVSMKPASVRSATFIDSASESAAFPSRIFEMPVLGEIVLGFRFAFLGLLRLCCSRSITGSVAEAYRLLLKGRDGRSAVVAAGKNLNYSFDLGEWADYEVLKGMPFQVLWSNTWSDAWIDEGRRAAAAVPTAKFASHSGGRWPQEDAADEIAEHIAQFVSSLPQSIRQVEEEPLPEHTQKMFDEASDGHNHHHHHHGHDHEHAAGYIDMYGLGQGWGS